MRLKIAGMVFLGLSLVILAGSLLAPMMLFGFAASATTSSRPAEMSLLVLIPLIGLPAAFFSAITGAVLLISGFLRKPV